MKVSDPILVTGGAGFIGSHLCEALLEKGFRVICLDNFCSFYSPDVKRNNIHTCLQNKDFTLQESDITDVDAVENVFAAHKPGLVIHLAAMAGVRPSILDPELYARVNFLGTQNLLQACARHSVDKFIFASSSSVYGNNTKVPFSESDRVDDPISPYAATKKAGELLCHTWHHLYGISTVCLRFFTVYGPRQRPDLAIHKFLHMMYRGESIPVFGDGSSSRDYTYISDIISGILGAIFLIQNNQCHEIINLGNDRSISLSEMIQTLEKVSGITAKLDLREMQSGDVLRTRADIAKARKLLAYEPSTQFEQGVLFFWDWYSSLL